MGRDTILVTGAAGTIGSAICRQIIQDGCARRIVAVDQAETPLFYLEQVLEPKAKAAGVLLRTYAESVTDWSAMFNVVKRTKPDAIIHAAAMKHVGLCDRNPVRAFQVNVDGTRNMGLLAVERRCPFVFISTDKAAKPTTLMGQTKRLAEIDSLVRFGDTTRIVRLVNVWASQGSVIPLIQRQVAAGGPVSLTHPDMRRLFMDVEAAATLALRAMDEPGGHIYMPRVGVRDFLIRDLIRKEVGERDIPVVVVGMRQGEKLAEDLTNEGEVSRDYGVISMVTPAKLPDAEWWEDRVKSIVGMGPDWTREGVADLAAWRWQ